MALIGSIEAFDESNSDFQTYLERFNQLLICNEVEDSKKLPLFITLCGGETFCVLKNLCMPDSPLDKTYAQCTALLKTHFNPSPLIVLERFKFHKRDQKPNETITDYIIALKQLARSCDFGTFLKETLRDRFICGLNNEIIQKKLLSEDNVTFDSACKIGLSMELASAETKLLHESSSISKVVQSPAIEQARSSYQGPQQAQLPNHHSQSANHKFTVSHGGFQKVSRNSCRNFGQSMSIKCRRCGRNHDSRYCPAVDWICFTCKKQGHTSRVCRSRGKIVNAVWENEDDNEQCNCIKQEEEDMLGEINMISSEVLEKSYSAPSNQVKNVNSIVHARKEPCYIDLKINNVLFKVEIDSGACTSVISSTIFYKYFKTVQLRPPELTYKSATSHKLTILGRVTVKVQFKDKIFSLELIVQDSKSTSPPLIGRPWLDKLFPGWRSFFSNFENKRVQTILLEKPYNCKTYVTAFERKFPAVFSQKQSTIIGFKAGISIKQDCSPIFCRAYQVPFALRPMVEEELTKLQSENVIYPVTSSDWASPVVIVPKQTGGIRICVDFRVSLNKVIDTEHYPLPKIEDILASLGGKKLFTLLDLTGAYQQLELFEESKVYFTINTHIGLFRYNKLTYGIKTAPAIFQRTMDEILRGVPNASCYIDDILIAGVHFAECHATVEQVLTRLSVANVRINPKKCRFFVPEVEYLGYLLTEEGVKPSPSKVEALRNAPTPHDATQLKAYLGMINFNRQFVHMQSSALSPLYRLTQKGVPFVWTDECQIAFETSKMSLSKQSLLVYYDPSKTLILSCDASNMGVGAVLCHEVNGTEVPIAFASATLTAAERNYPQVEKEGLAIIFGIKRFHKFIFGRPFVLYTDNLPLKSIFDPSRRISVTASSRLQRWAILLSGYNYTIRHKKSLEMATCDALSRLPLTKETTKEMPDSLIKSVLCNERIPFNFKDVAKATRADVILSKVSALTQSGWSNHISDPSLQPYFIRRNSLSVEQGCVVWGIRVIIPTSLQHYVLTELHRNHPGIVKIKMIARSFCWWPSIDKDLEDKVKLCASCQRFQSSNNIEKEYEGWPEYHRAWIRIHADFLHLFGKTVLLLVDSTSKWIDLYLMKRSDASEVVSKFRKSFAVFGIPQFVVTDNGPPFNSQEFVSFLSSLGVEAKKSPPYYPRANGLAEVEVKTVKRSIIKTVGSKVLSERELEAELDKFLFYYRNSPCPSTSRTPAEFLLKQSPRSILSQLRPNFGQNELVNLKLEKPKCTLNFPDKLFYSGDKVLLWKDKIWTAATVLQAISKSRYLINVNGQIRIAHRQQLRATKLAVEDSTAIHQKQQLLKQNYNLPQGTEATIERAEEHAIADKLPQGTQSTIERAEEHAIADNSTNLRTSESDIAVATGARSQRQRNPK